MEGVFVYSFHSPDLDNTVIDVEMCRRSVTGRESIIWWVLEQWQPRPAALQLLHLSCVTWQRLRRCVTGDG